MHLYYGSDSGAQLDERRQEIETIVDYLSHRAGIGLKDDRALILLGDFNSSATHKAMQALLKDQIAFKTKPDVLEHVDRQSDDALRRNAGVFKLFGSEFKWDEHEAHGLATSALHGSQYGGDHVKSFRDWRTYQMSDHNPLWARLAVNGADSYLARLRAE